MPKILVLYASKHGHTAKIATRIATVLAAEGVEADVREAGGDDADPALLAYDGVLVGASIHGGNHESEILDWAAGHRAQLALLPNAFFSVCLTAADDTAESHAATRRYLDEFVEATGWTPDRSVTFAGALQYREYDFATRLVMRLLMRRGGHPTDASHDYDYTDWDAVERFARDCAGRLQATAAGG